MRTRVPPAGAGLLEPDERILWWLRARPDSSRRRYLLRRFSRPAGAFSVAGLATLVTFLVVMPLLHSIRLDLTAWMLPLLVGAGLVVSAGVLLTAVGLLSLLIPEPGCPPSPKVISDMLYVFTTRRLLVVRASRGSGHAYQPGDLAPDGQLPPTYRIDNISPGVGHILVGVQGPSGWTPRMCLWGVPDPARVVARIQTWAGRQDCADGSEA